MQTVSSQPSQFKQFIYFFINIYISISKLYNNNNNNNVAQPILFNYNPKESTENIDYQKNYSETSITEVLICAIIIIFSNITQFNFARLILMDYNILVYVHVFF